LENYKNENYCWMIALKMVDAFLNDFSYSLQAKQILMEKLSNSYKLEFGFNQINSKQFNSLYRDNKSLVESVLGNKISDDRFKKLCYFIKKRSVNIEATIEKLIIYTERNKKTLILDNLISSYLHMTFNRLFVSKNRTYELILYDFLKRFYTSELAKIKYQDK